MGTETSGSFHPGIDCFMSGGDSRGHSECTDGRQKVHGKAFRTIPRDLRVCVLLHCAVS